MSCLHRLLSTAARDLQPRLQGQMNGFAGPIVRQYLPQTWVFRTEEGSVSLLVDRAGQFQAVNGEAPGPDVTIETSHARLEGALRTRHRESVPPGPFQVTRHTPKGDTAYTFLRSRLGLD